MKKEKSNYAARDAIKFLEKELGEGNRFIRAQKDSETVNVSKRKPAKQEIDIWYDRIALPHPLVKNVLIKLYGFCQFLF